jgi:ketosteroid isomerase-like protein
MSNAEHAVQGIEAFNRRDFDTALAGFNPDIEWEASADLGPDPMVYRGHAGVMEFWDGWLGTMDDFELEVTEAREAPGDRVFVTTRARARGKGSGAPVEGELHQVFEYRDGSVGRVKLFGSRSAALTAAGLEGR